MLTHFRRHVALIARDNGYVQQKKLLCNCCKIRESDWYMLLILAESKSIHQSEFHEFYNSCKVAFLAERSHSLRSLSVKVTDTCVCKMLYAHVYKLSIGIWKIIDYQDFYGVASRTVDEFIRGWSDSTLLLFVFPEERLRRYPVSENDGEERSRSSARGKK